MKDQCRILRDAAFMLAVIACSPATAATERGSLSLRLTIVDSCTVSGVDPMASTAIAERRNVPVRVACSGGAASAVTFARVTRATAFAAGIAPPGGEGTFSAISDESGGSAIRATVTF